MARIAIESPGQKRANLLLAAAVALARAYDATAPSVDRIRAVEDFLINLALVVGRAENTPREEVQP
jgi:hypothetical protein